MSDDPTPTKPTERGYPCPVCDIAEHNEPSDHEHSIADDYPCEGCVNQLDKIHHDLIASLRDENERLTKALEQIRDRHTPVTVGPAEWARRALEAERGAKP